MTDVTLSQVADHIEQHPDQFDMQHFGYRCSTAGCVAWHAVKVSGRGFDKERLIDNQAQTLMDLSEVEARELFLTRSIERSNNLTYIQERADIVPAALRWMERTGTINWQQALDAVEEPAP